MEDTGRQLLDLRRHGGAEHQVLAAGRQLGDHFFYVMDKAHIQHPVGLVQHKDLHPGQVHMALTDQVVQAAGAGHQDLHPGAQGLHLGRLAHTAKNDGAAQGQILAVGGKALADLQRQLPGRGQDQRPDRTGLFGLSRRKTVQHGQPKRCGLAGAGLGTAHQIPPGQHRGDGRRLDRRRHSIARLPHCTQHRGRQVQFFKCHGSPWFKMHRRGFRYRLFGVFWAQKTPGGAAFGHCAGSIFRHSM